MKNLFTGIIVMLVLLPQVSFGATQPSVDTNPALTSFNAQQESDAAVFFQQQVNERAAFIKANADIIGQQDQKVRAWKQQRDAQIHQAKLSGNMSSIPPAVLPPITDSTFAAFMQKQFSDKQAFFATQAQAKQKFLASQS